MFLHSLLINHLCVIVRHAQRPAQCAVMSILGRSRIVVVNDP